MWKTFGKNSKINIWSSAPRTKYFFCFNKKIFLQTLVKIISNISKIISASVCKKIFLLKQKNLNQFYTGYSNSALRGGKTNFLDFFL